MIKKQKFQKTEDVNIIENQNNNAPVNNYNAPVYNYNAPVENAPIENNYNCTYFTESSRGARKHRQMRSERLQKEELEKQEFSDYVKMRFPVREEKTETKFRKIINSF